MSESAVKSFNMTSLQYITLFLLAVIGAYADPLCERKTDGYYPLRDTFKYLKCTSGKGSIIDCPENQVFISREEKCRTVTYADRTNICEGLPDGDYRDPWNCNKFLKCVAETVYEFKCRLPNLVFNPISDKCVYSHEYPCKIVKPGNDVGDIACMGKPDGKYPRRDTFTYLQCISQTGHVVSCPTNQVYIHRERRCRNVTVGDQTIFCEGLPNDDYRYPWNCHMFYKCYSGVTYPFNCQLPSLVFDPSKDQCVYPEQYPCTVVHSSKKSNSGDAACSGKEDGKYPLADTLKYLQCTKQYGTIMNCPTNQVYIHREQRCRSVTVADQATICEGLPNGDYRDPWDCHGFFKCFVDRVFTFNCQKPPLKQLVFHPERDECVFPRDFPCFNVPSVKPLLSATANRCTGKPDGNYVIADVFSYLQCKGGVENVVSCPANQIFVAAKKACSAVTTAYEDIFCNGRSNGNYRNPWNCHHFITCVAGHPAPFDRPCHPLSLVYDPNNDRCEHSTLFACKNLTSPTPPKNRCTGKPDGLYILADVFKYLECKAGQEILHFCPSKQIFAPDIMACRAVVPSDKVNFCNKRPTGNYRNPWNCHHFITCVTGHPIYDRPCHPLTLVYDPDNNLCEHDNLMTCVQV